MRSLRPLFFGCMVLLWPLVAQCAPQAGHTGSARHLSTHPLKMEAHSEGNLSVDFFPLPDGAQILGTQSGATLNLGKVSYAGQPEHTGITLKHSSQSFSVQTAIGIRIGTGNFAGETVQLKAWLEVPAEPYHIYFDNVPMTLQPQLVNSHTQLGIITRHELNITVPQNTSESQSAFRTMISLQVIRN